MGTWQSGHDAVPTFSEYHDDPDAVAFRDFASNVLARRRSCLWRLHGLLGSPAGKSPMAYLQTFGDLWQKRLLAFGPEGQLFADNHVAMRYMEWADPWFRVVAGVMRERAAKTTPAGLLLLSPDPVTTALGLDATMKRGGFTASEARERILRGVVEETAEMEDRRREEVVAEIQRLLREPEAA